MGKTLIVKINSRKSSSEDDENKIINALTQIGLIHDGRDFCVDETFNRHLFFFLNDDIDFEVVDADESPIEE